MSRIALGIEYDGSRFSGWQMQSHSRSVQSCIEEAVARVANERIDVVCAGRTDAGVHATEQVAHFDTHASREMHSWLMGINSNLPDDVRVLWVRELDEAFHARYSAIARLYRYVILNRPVRSALQPKQATWCFYPLDEMRMQAAAAHLIGEHDFSSFRAQGCQSNSPWRILHFIRVERQADRIFVDVCGNAFLHHMVRNIAGVLMDVGRGKRNPDWVKDLLEARDRSQGSVTAPPEGLYLSGIYYPAEFGMAGHPLFQLLPEGTTRHVPSGTPLSTSPADVSLYANSR